MRWHLFVPFAKLEPLGFGRSQATFFGCWNMKENTVLQCCFICRKTGWRPRLHLSLSTIFLSFWSCLVQNQPKTAAVGTCAPRVSKPIQEPWADGTLWNILPMILIMVLPCMVRMWLHSEHTFLFWMKINRLAFVFVVSYQTRREILELSFSLGTRRGREWDRKSPSALQQVSKARKNVYVGLALLRKHKSLASKLQFLLREKEFHWEMVTMPSIETNSV